jgi:serpin B
VHEEFGRLIADLDSIGKSGRCSLSIADGVWIQRGFPVLPGFAGMVEKHYHAHLGAADFVRDRAAARREINLWVRERTAEALPDLLAADVLDDLTRLVLVNAVYFKGRWADRFDPAETRPEAFTLADGTRVEVPMMHHRGRFAYAELPGLKILRLPYEEPRLCMIILLPDAGGGTGAVEGQLTTAALQSWLKLARLHAVEVWLPRFGVCYTARLDSALQQLGMVRAFDEGVADFTGISSAELLFVQHVVHGAMVKVDEEGTEAAAVTGVAVGCGVPEQLPEAEFRADRPFLFVIADVQVSTLLFVGRIARPTP